MFYKNVRNLVISIVLLVFLSQFITAAGPAVVNLGTAGNFAILAKSGVSTTGTTSVVGDIGVSPIDSTAITGFGLILDSTTQFSTSSLVTGKIYAADYSPPTPINMGVAIGDMQTAYTDAAGRTNPTATELGAGNLDGMTIIPGLYKWGTGVTIPISLTLSGSATDVWIFQIAQNLDIGNGAIITLSGGAQAQNVFWQVAGQATLGTTSDFKGIILSQTAIVLNTGASLKGRALAQTAVTLNANAVVTPTGSSGSISTVTSTPTTNPITPTPTVNGGGSGYYPTVTPTVTVKPTVTPKPTINPTATAKPTVKPTVTPKPTTKPAIVSVKPTVTSNITPTIVPATNDNGSVVMWIVLIVLALGIASYFVFWKKN